MAARRLEKGREDEEVLPKVEQVPQGSQGAQGSQGVQVPIGGKGNGVLVIPLEMTNGQIRQALLLL